MGFIVGNSFTLIVLLCIFTRTHANKTTERNISKELNTLGIIYHCSCRCSLSWTRSLSAFYLLEIRLTHTNDLKCKGIFEALNTDKSQSLLGKCADYDLYV